MLGFFTEPSTPRAEAQSITTASPVKAAAEAHPDKVVLWFMDQARVGQKSRTTPRWWVRGERPPGIADKRFQLTYLPFNLPPLQDIASVLPCVSAAADSTSLLYQCDSVRPRLAVYSILVRDLDAQSPYDNKNISKNRS